MANHVLSVMIWRHINNNLKAENLMQDQDES